MADMLEYYLKAFKRLRRANGIAPHKPVLLISILQAFQNNLITENKIEITPELVALFKTNWNALVRTNHDCRFSYPFYYMKSEPFWKLIPKPGFENINLMGSIMKSISTLNAAVEFAQVDDELFNVLKNKTSNAVLLKLLLDNYFPDMKNNFNDSSGELQKIFDDIEKKITKNQPEEYRSEMKKLVEQNDEEEIFLRSNVFKREVVRIYNNTCCISGMKIDTTLPISMVDACHIVPFSRSYDDTITNGIALCPNLHRAFDRGLIAIDDDYRVIVSSSFKEQESSYTVLQFNGKQIYLPNQKAFLPSKENLEWHRNNIFNMHNVFVSNQ